MENLTDLLTNIFVSQKSTKHQDKAVETIKEEDDRRSSVSTSNSSNSSDSSSNSSSNSSDSSSDSSSESVKSDDLKSKKTETEESEKSEDSDTSESEIEESDESDDESSIQKVSDEVSKSVQKATEVSRSVQKATEISKAQKAPETELSKKSVKKSSEVVPTPKIRKLVLKASEFYKKNILVVNNDNAKNIEILSDLLFKLSKMNDVENLYDNSLHIYTFTENKKDFRDMLLENPYLYFNNLVIKSSLSFPKLESDKRHLFIIDYNVVADMEKLHKLMSYDNVHIIVYHNSYSSDVLSLYKLLGNSTLIINSKDRLKILQKRFYSKIIKHLVEIDDFYDAINDDNVDAKYLIVKNNELRYS